MPPSVPRSSSATSACANGLRVIVAEDHLAPVVAVNLWYDVGSKHEVPGKTGFAHLFEHVMFQGSRHVAKAEHIALVQAAGGTMNGSTWLDRTNYFETMPAHQLELGLWLEADRMATLLDALSQENLDNQREVVKNEKRWSYDNRPYGSWQEKLQGHLFPPEHPYHHSTIGSMDDLDAASLEDVSAFFRTYYAPNNAVLSVVGDVETGRRPRRRPSGTSGAIPANPTIPPLRRPVAAADARRRASRDGPRPRAAAARSTSASARRSSATRGSTRSTLAGQILAGGKGSRLNRRLVREERIAQDVALFTLGVHRRRVGLRRLGDRPARASTSRASRPPSTRSSSGSTTELVSDDELARAKALTEADELGVAPARRGAGRPAVDVRDAVRRPGTRSTRCCRATWR